MTSKTKKLLYILASMLILAGFSSNTVLNSDPTVSAAKHHKKKHTKKKHHVKKKAAKHKANNDKSNSSTSGANNSTTTGSSSSDNTIEPQSKYSSLADWYVANGLKLYSKYTYNRGSSNNLADAQEFGLGYTNGEGGVIYTEHYNNELYKEGQILGTTFNDAAPEYAVTALPQQTGKTMKQLYQDAIDAYNSAGPYIQANGSYKVIQIIGPNNQWGPDGG